MTGASPLPWEVIVVDDEPLARRTLRVLLANQRDFAIVAECGHGAQAIETIAHLQPDLVFLDVHMPEVDGFAVLQRLGPDQLPLLVFVTAHDKYALRAFEQHAFDYLLKPFSDERFAAVLNRVRKQLHERNEAAVARELTMMLSRKARRQGRSLVLRDAGRTMILPPEDIVWIEAEDYCARIHLRDRDLLVLNSLKSLGEELEGMGFVRIHRSAIANLQGIRSLEPVASGDQRMTLTDGTTLKVSRTHRAEGLEALRRVDSC